MSDTIIEHYPGSGKIVWCNCQPAPKQPWNGNGNRYCDAHGGTMAAWVRIEPKYAKTWGCPEERPADRIENIAPHVVGLRAALEPLEPREFDGFCTPCGGLRKHKLGCPVKR